MAFCMKCGAQIDDNSQFCPSCGQASVASAPPPPPAYQAPPQQPGYQQPPQPGYQQPMYGQPYAGAQVQQNPFAADFTAAIKKLFSKNPQDAIDTATASASPLWAVFAGISAIIAGLSVLFYTSGTINSIIRSIGKAMDLRNRDIRDAIEFAQEAMADVLPYGGRFGYGLILALISFFLLSALIKLICVIYKADAPFSKIMNLTAASTIIPSLLCIAGIIFSFFFIQLSYVLLVAALISCVVSLYYGLQEIVPFRESPLWLYIAAHTVNIAVVALFASVLFNAFFDFEFDDLSYLF